MFLQDIQDLQDLQAGNLPRLKRSGSLLQKAVAVASLPLTAGSASPAGLGNWKEKTDQTSAFKCGFYFFFPVAHKAPLGGLGGLTRKFAYNFKSFFYFLCSACIDLINNYKLLERLNSLIVLYVLHDQS